MITEILLPLAAVAVAELGDKTQLSILLLSSKTERHLRLLLGVVSAFFIVDGIAVLVGSWITNIVFDRNNDSTNIIDSCRNLPRQGRLEQD